MRGATSLRQASALGRSRGADCVEECSERRCVVEVAALGLPLPPLVAVAVERLSGPFDLGRGPLEAGPDLIGLQFGDRPQWS
jgi:hypothetical protein